MTTKDVPVQSTRTSSRFRALTAGLIAAALALGGALIASPASAAPGDVAGATLDWGVKASFRSYLTGPIAHGTVTATGVSTATPYVWSSGTGSATGGTGTVAYPGTLQFQGHQGVGVDPDQYALDLTFSDVKVKLTGTSTAELILDAHSRGLADPTSFVDLDDVVFATLDLAGGVNGSTAEAVAYTGVPATLTADGSAAFGGFYTAGQALDPVSFSWPVEQADEPGTPGPSTPTLTVSKTTGLNPDGETVTVSGAGYNPAQAIYVIVCKDVPLSEVNFAFAGPCTAGSKQIGASTSSSATKFTAAGSFSVTMDVSKNVAFDSGSAIYTLANHTAMGDRSQDAKQAISFTPLLTVSKAAGLDPAGETLTVNGYGYNPAQPIYLILCRDVPLSEVSFAFASGCISGSSAIYASTDTNPARAKFAADGSFSTQFTVANSAALGSGAAIYTLANHTAMADRSQDAKRAISFVTGTATTTTLTSSAASVLAGGSVTLTASVTPASAGSVAFYNGTEPLGSASVLGGIAQQTVADLSVGTASFRAVFTPDQPWLIAGSEGAVTVTVTSPVAAAGSLTWGVKSDFRAYITGPIAQGSITTSGVTTSGGAFVFPQSANGLTESGTGTASYSGSVRFYGHAGALDITLRNPVVTVTSPTSGTLSVTWGGSSVPVASLNLGAGIRSTANGSVSYSAVPATLTAAGVPVFGNYPAGTALDPVSFVVGSNGSVVGGSSTTTTTAAFVGAKVPAATPPATTGVTLAAGTELEEGGEVTITADGFRPNETGIMVVIYSSPVVLARDLIADANGVVTWTGRLPVGLTGEHTLTVQGSVDRGIVLNIPAAAKSAVEGCPVDDATITWGFKESFRSYISGSIANGEWTVADGATYETPNFGWSKGTGGYDSETAKGLLAFTGSIDFTGHSGALNTVVANPQIEFVDEDTAYLLLDVSGTTQAGDPVEQKAVRFVTLSLADGEHADKDGAVSFTAVPTTLTDEGAAAFGTYEAGSAFDPITVSFTTTDCATLAAAAAEATPVKAAPVESSSNPTWLWWVIGAVVLAAIIAAVIVLVTRRRATAA